MELSINEIQYMLDALDTAWMYAELADDNLPEIHEVLHDKLKQELVKRTAHAHKERIVD